MRTKESPPATIQPPSDRLDRWLYAIATAGVWAGLFVPIVYAPITQYPFGLLKVAWLQAVVGLSFPAFLLLAWRCPEFRPCRSPMVLAVLVQLGTVALSVPFAEEPARAWWGTGNRMDGLWSILHFTAWSLMVASMARTRRQWRGILLLVIGMGFLAGCVALLQLPFPRILGPATDVRVSGLFGNPIFSSAFHALIIFLIVFLWASEQRPRPGLKVFYLAAGLVSIAAMVLAGSRGPALGLVVGLVVTATVVGLLGSHWKKALAAIIAIVAAGGLHIAMAKLIVPLPQLQPFWNRHANLAHFFVIRDDAERLGRWQMTLMGIKERPIFGWGPSNFENLGDRHYLPLQHCDESVWFDSAHNLVLQALATSGVVGLAGLLVLWTMVVASIVRACRRGALQQLPAGALVGLCAAYLTQAMFNPDSPGALLICHFVFALAIGLWRPLSKPIGEPRRRPDVIAFVLAELAGLALVVTLTVLPVYASHAARSTEEAFWEGRLTDAWQLAQRTARIPTPYLDKQLRVDLQLLEGLAESRAPEHADAWRELLAINRDLARRCFAYHRNPRLWMIYALSLHSSAVAKHDAGLYRESEQELREAVRRHPSRRDLVFSLASILVERGQLDEAELLYRKTVDQEPRMGESSFNLGRFLWLYRNQETTGASLVAQATRCTCPYLGLDVGELSVIARAFIVMHDTDGLRALASTAETLLSRAAPQDYLRLAGHFEAAGLDPERDSILRLGLRRFPDLAAQVLPVLHRRARLRTNDESRATPIAKDGR